MKRLIAAVVISGSIAVGVAGASEIIYCAGGPIICNGTGGDDTMIGAGGIDDIRGHGGKDALNGFGSADILRGGSDRDQAAGGTGNDVIYGGDASDNPLVGGCFASSAPCPPGRNRIFGMGGDDVIGLDNGVGGEIADGGFGFDTAFVDANDDARMVERCIVNGTRRACP